MQAGRTTRTATNVRKERTFRSGPYLDKLFGAGGQVDAYLERQICERIKQARKTAGLTQEDMANLLGVTTRAYQNYERDRVPFRLLTRIADVTNVEERWLLHGPPTEDDLARAELLRQVADGVATIERSQENVLERLVRIEDLLSPPEAARPSH
jgi:transcriptional regulator with XRE-family HTH domain